MAKRKLYRSNSVIHLNVRVGGHVRHVSFNATTSRGSTLSTGDAALQDALERHPFFGTKFRLVREFDDSAVVAPVRAVAAATKQRGPIVIRVTDVSDAREKLAEKSGMSRTKVGRTWGELEATAGHLGYVLERVL